MPMTVREKERHIKALGALWADVMESFRRYRDARIAELKALAQRHPEGRRTCDEIVYFKHQYEKSLDKIIHSAQASHRSRAGRKAAS